MPELFQEQSHYFGEEPNDSFISNVTIIEAEVIVKGDYYPWLLSFPLLLFLLVCTCANAIIFVFVFASKTYRSPANYLLANLCLVSTIYIVNLVIFTLEKEYELWSYGPLSCIAASCFHRLPLPLMTLTIMTLSLDRSRIARNPLNHPSKSSVMLQIFLVWFVSFTLMIPRGMISYFDPNSQESYKCKKLLLLNSRVAQAIYAIMNLLIIHVLPGAYLIKEWKKTRNQMKYLAACQVEQGKSFARRLRLMRNACIFTCIFVTCWLPLGILQFPIDWMSPERISCRSLYLTRDIFRQAVLIQACINPLLLQVLSFDFQEFLTSCIA